jgi:glycosyltransferase involved in cell wall biosynthesis
VKPPAPEVSVLMPLRNAAATVATAVASIAAQDFPHWELVAVDDGSTDDTAEILRQLSAQDQRIRPIPSPPRGIAAALAAGCSSCRGQFIARMDADDTMMPRRLGKQRNFLECHPQLGLVSCRVRFGGASAGYSAHVDWINSLTDPEAIQLRRFVEAPVAHPSVMFRRELVAQHGGYREGDFPEDYELWLRWLEAGVGFAKLEEELLLWNDPPGRLSRTDGRYSESAFYQTKIPYLQRWLQANVPAHRALWLWGAGRITRRRFDGLEATGARFQGFIDVDPAKAGRHRDGRVVRMADDLPPREESFILAGVAARGARDKIEAHLRKRGWTEGRDFLLVA